MKGNLALHAFGALLLLGVANPGIACVVCGTAGSCYDQPVTLSGNCECSITSKFGSLVCRPKGVCDPEDPNTCSNIPPVLVGEVESPVVDSHFLDLAAREDAPLASAIWGAMDQEKDARGVLVQTHIAPGDHMGTLGTVDHRSFKYTVQARQFAPSMLALKVTLEEEGTDSVQRYEGALYHNGLQGELVRLGADGSATPVVVWDLRQKPDRDGKAPHSSQ